MEAVLGIGAAVLLGVFLLLPAANIILRVHYLGGFGVHRYRSCHTRMTITLVSYKKHGTN